MLLKAQLPASSLRHKVLLSTATPASSSTSLSTALYNCWSGCQLSCEILKAIITATALQLCLQHPLNVILPDQALCLVCSPGPRQPLFGVHRRGSLLALSTPCAPAHRNLISKAFPRRQPLPAFFSSS